MDVGNLSSGSSAISKSSLNLWKFTVHILSKPDLENFECNTQNFPSQTSTYINRECPDVQAEFRKGRETWGQISNFHWIIEKARAFKKKSTFVLVITPKALTVWITTNCRKFFKRWEYQTTLPASWEICMQVKKQQLELDVEQWTGSKLGKEYVKAVYCHPAF